MTTAVQDVLAKTRVPSADLETLKKEKDELAKHLQESLPVEKKLRAHITKRLEEIKKEAGAYLGSLDGHANDPLPIVDLEVLRWRHDKPNSHGIICPKLALVNVKATYMQLPFAYGCIENELGLNRYYGDVEASCERKNRPPSHIRDGVSASRIVFEYNGAIPSEQRKMMLAEQENFDEMFLLIDSPVESWEYLHTKTRRLPMPELVLDPLICGWRQGAMFLLGQFDPTPVEKYVELEFTFKPALNAAPDA